MADGARCSNLSFTFLQTVEPLEISPRWWATEFLWDLCPTLLFTYMQVKRHQLELNMEQQTGSKLGMEYVKAVYCHPAYLTYTQSTS